MNLDWDDGNPVVHVGDANDEIDEDPDWGKFYGDKLVPRGMDSGVSYDDQRLIWVDQLRVDHEDKVRLLENAPSGLVPYRFAWNGNQLHQADAVAVLKSLIGNDLDEELSLGSCVFGCKGVTNHDVAGNEKAGKSFSGGGCTVFIRRRRHVDQFKRVRYVFATAGGSALKMVADLEPAPLAGMNGSRLGDLMGDSYMKTFEPRRRNYEIGSGIALALKMPELRLEVRSQKKDGQWNLVVYTVGGGAVRAAANRKLKNGVTVLFDKMNVPFKLSNSTEIANKARKVQQESRRVSMADEFKSTEGRRIKVYRLTAEAVDNAELQGKVTEQLQKFGAVDSSVIRHSKDGCSWMVAVYETVEAAAAACDDDAIADALTAEDLADPEQGFCVCERCSVEKDMAYLAKKDSVNKPARTSFVTYMQAANGEAADVDAMLAGLLKSEKTTQGLLEQVVNPTVKGVRKELVSAGRRVANQVSKVVQDEVQSLREDLGAMKDLLEAVVGTKSEVLKRRKVARAGEKRSRSRPRSRTGSGTRTPARSVSGTPASVVKAVRKRRGFDGAAAEDVEKGAAMRMLQALMANKNGPAIVAQMVNDEDQATLASMFDKAADMNEDDEEDDEDDDMSDDEEEEEFSDGD